MKPVIVLLLLAVGAPMLALLPTTEQDPDKVDWTAAVNKACTSRRYGLRLAAARRVAGGGGAAIPAVTAWAEKNGRNALPDTLVDFIAKATTTDEPVVELLFDWATDQNFYWRSYAFLGLANRATALPAQRDRLVDLFGRHRDDPAWLVATYARLGLHVLDTGDREARADDDPRIASKLCGLLLERGQTPSLQPLLDALADERTFQGMTWGQLRAKDAHQALRRALGEQHPMANGNAAEDKLAMIAEVRSAMAAKWGQQLTMPELRTDPATAFPGGIEVQSCRDGDLHLQWTADGGIYQGLEARFVAQLPAAVWTALQQERTEIAFENIHGVVICDNMRVKWEQPETHAKVAPESLPAGGKEWLGKLAQALQDADKPVLAAALRQAIDQFGARL